MWQAIKLTFGSVWGWLGIIVGAISLINLGVMYFDVGIGPVLERVVEAYKAIVHRGFDILFLWVDWQMPVWAKDLVTLYFVFGASGLRGFNMQHPYGSRSRGHMGFRESGREFFLWWLTGYRVTRYTLWTLAGQREFKPSKAEVKWSRKHGRETFWQFWMPFLSVPLAVFCFIVLGSGL